MDKKSNHATGLAYDTMAEDGSLLHHVVHSAPEFQIGDLVYAEDHRVWTVVRISEGGSGNRFHLSRTGKGRGGAIGYPANSLQLALVLR